MPAPQPSRRAARFGGLSPARTCGLFYWRI
nr:MAG TPA: hypothetical protein [Caudoviricetes sp.]